MATAKEVIAAVLAEADEKGYDYTPERAAGVILTELMCAGWVVVPSEAGPDPELSD